MTNACLRPASLTDFGYPPLGGTLVLKRMTSPPAPDEQILNLAPLIQLFNAEWMLRGYRRAP